MLLAVVIAAALGAAFDHNFADTQPKQFIDGARLVALIGQQADFRAAGQKDVGVLQHEGQGIAHFGNAQHFFAHIGVKRNRAAVVFFNDFDGLLDGIDNAEREQR